MYKHITLAVIFCITVVTCFSASVKGNTDLSAIPRVDVLEKIYYLNAVRLYPRVKNVLTNLGYEMP